MSLSSLALNSERTALPSGGAPNDHTVQFYESEEFLCDVVVDYVEAGLEAGEPVVVVATKEHAQAFCQQLERRGVNVEIERASQRFTLLDADYVLSRILADGMPRWHLFEREVGTTMARLARLGADGRVRAYGEMVDVLWRSGRADAAAELESMWNRLLHGHSFSLLCAYSIEHFRRESDVDSFAPICDHHGRVLPTEDYLAHRGEDARLREVSLLQQRARALEGEISRRRELEASLRDALAARQILDEELRRQNEELLRKVRFSEMFVGILGHDLRNPLSAITTAAQVLSRRAESDRVAVPAQRITNSAMRMSRMIDQLLDFTRIRLGNGIPIERKPVDLLEVCRLVVDELDIGAALGRIHLETAGDLRGQWDADRLGQLTSNLLGNALAHGVAGRPVTMHLDGSGDSVVFGVHNDGAMHPDSTATLFQPFGITGEQKLQRSSGFGLGLYISQQIVVAHGGTIDVTSSEADGTRIVVRLPRDAPARDADLGLGPGQ